MSTQLTAKTAAINSIRIALKLVANDQTSFAPAQNADDIFSAIKPCSLAQVIGESAIDLEIDVSSLDAGIDNLATASQQTLSFSDYFAQAIAHIEQQHTVLLSHPAIPYRVLMMPAIVAAKHRCHPHAYLTGLGEADDMQCAMQNALAQAKREHITPTLVDVTELTCYKDKFTQLVMLISRIAARRLPDTTLPTVTSDKQNNSNQANAKYWFTQMHQNRVASFNFTENGKQHAAVFVQGTELAQASSMLDENRLFFPLAANTSACMIQSLHELLVALNRLNQQQSNPLDSQRLLNKPSHVISLMLNYLKAFDQTKSLSAVIIANSVVTAIAEIEAMLAKISTASDDTSGSINELEYKTPSGSCLTITHHEALGRSGVCFVYPGVGTVYPQMFAQLPQYFPALFAQLERDGDVKAMLQADCIYAENAKTSDMNLGELAIAGVGASYILTKVLTEHFAIKPDFAMGYSMGEASMWASLNVWKTPHNMIEATQTNSIFTSDISGRLDCVRQAWQLEQGEDIVWNSFVVRAAPTEIEAVLADYPRAYLAIIQGDTCVLAGCEQSCKALLKQIGKRGIAANRVTAMHTQPAMLIRDNVQAFYQQALHDQDVLDAQASSIKFISAASQIPISLTSQDIANSIADTFCQPLNFTKLVNNARHLGARLFVEIGADRQTSTLIDKIARTAANTDSHLNAPLSAIAINAKGDDQTALLKCIAQLISHKVPLSLQYLTENLSHLLTASITRENRQQSQTAQLAPQLEGEQS
ncbi:PfaB family protein [Shewanella japonica]|uniref:Omega-3 polyunsaturated fatty acid synthase PfaB n=1 Tax=Shewanella japonica TaxID=93973 RepID=A0ABN4YBB2_9GAMM|nr:PfaB family protein [Shewanella japonica]ARD21698.1 Omega-3 polyunsaturated fatty acid synthase PfaB [Shewanella japonica]